jgi:hypothetical protein
VWPLLFYGVEMVQASYGMIVYFQSPVSMTGRRSVVPGLEGGRSKKKYRCQASGCGVTPRGSDLSQHYKSKTDWDKVKRMNAAMGTAALEKLLQEADPHTRFIFEKHYAENRLPTYTSHIMVNETEVTVEGSNAGTKQLKIGGFFQVRNLATGDI